MTKIAVPTVPTPAWILAALCAAPLLHFFACTYSVTPSGSGAGGHVVMGGSTATGGTSSSGGDSSSGGTPASGGSSATGGSSPATGGAAVTGGSSFGGSSATGGATFAGGTTANGGNLSTGGRTSGNQDAGTPDARSPDTGRVADAAAKVSFKTQILPLLNSNCAGCHGASVQNAGVRVDSYAGVSASLQAVTDAIVNGYMPLTGPLSAANVQLFQAWVDQGALNN